MIIVVQDHTYETDEKSATGILHVARGYISKGIYAIEGDDYTELKNIECANDEELARQVQLYRSKGFKVHYKA